MELGITPLESRDKMLLAMKIFGMKDPEPAFLKYRQGLRKIGLPVPIPQKIIYHVRRD